MLKWFHKTVIAMSFLLFNLNNCQITFVQFICWKMTYKCWPLEVLRRSESGAGLGLWHHGEDEEYKGLAIRLYFIIVQRIKARLSFIYLAVQDNSHFCHWTETHAYQPAGLYYLCIMMSFLNNHFSDYKHVLGLYLLSFYSSTYSACNKSFGLEKEYNYNLNSR